MYLSILLTAALTLSSALQMSPPNPQNLDVSWWSYLENEETFDENIQKLTNELVNLRQSVNEEESPLVAGELERVLLDIQELRITKSKEVSYTPSSPLFLDSYSLSDWFKISHKIRQLNKQMGALRSDNAKNQAQIDLLRQNLDLNQIHYNVLDRAPLKRILLGLEIMRLRLELEIREVEIAQNRSLIRQMEQDKERLLEERDFATDHLDLSNLESSAMEERREEYNALYVKAHKNLLETEKEALEATDKDLAELKVILAKSELELAQSTILFQEILCDIAKPNDHVLTSVEEWTKKLSIIDKKTSHQEEIVHKIDKEKTPQNEEWVATRDKALATLNHIDATIADAHLLMDMLLQDAEDKNTGFAKITIKSKKAVKEVSSYLERFFTTSLFHINDNPITPWTLLRSLIIFALFILFGKFITHRFKNHARAKQRLGRSNTYAMSKIGYYVLVLLGVLAAFFSLGFNMTNFVIIAGALGVGIGLGLQSIVNNFVSGIVLLFEKRVRIGDIIEIDKDNMGPVKSINMQNTHIRTFDGRGVVIPNSDFLTKRYINWTMEDNYIRLRVPFSVAYGTDVELVKTVVAEAAKECPETVIRENIYPEPKVWMVELGNSALNFQLIVWVDFTKKANRTGLYSVYYYLIEDTLRKHNIKIPFPQRDVWFHNKPD